MFVIMFTFKAGGPITMSLNNLGMGLGTYIVMHAKISIIIY